MTQEFAGALRERVSIENRVQDRDVWAGAAGGYAYAGAVWAAVAPGGSSALVAGEALSAAERWRVTMRQRDDLSLSTRLVWRGRYLKVRGTESDPRVPDRIVATCEEQR